MAAANVAAAIAAVGEIPGEVQAEIQAAQAEIAAAVAQAVALATGEQVLSITKEIIVYTQFAGRLGSLPLHPAPDQNSSGSRAFISGVVLGVCTTGWPIFFWRKKVFECLPESGILLLHWLNLDPQEPPRGSIDP